MFGNYFSRLVTPVKEEQQPIRLLVEQEATTEELLRQELQELRSMVESLMRFKRIPLATVQQASMDN